MSMEFIVATTSERPVTGGTNGAPSWVNTAGTERRLTPSIESKVKR